MRDVVPSGGPPVADASHAEPPAQVVAVVAFAAAESGGPAPTDGAAPGRGDPAASRHSGAAVRWRRGPVAPRPGGAAPS
ncbi:hypothetical protein GCM10010249_24540 [Streptomyces roseolilacinus]|uniref:Uncharacterized protein n=1 Tax=Streptomyces roseolilacinus TaxID=66904 RepID=A0A918ELP0_9ACTN|nr:hypothetical protein GCM10010249_24540 [Streptomyces roseolilacinus]